MPDADNELVERYRRGDTAAMETLLFRWERQVQRLLLRLAPNSHDVDDLRQEVFLRVVKAAETYRADWAFSTLLYRIVMSVARDAQRREQRRARTAEAVRDRPVVGGAPPEQQAANREAAELVADALESLPDELREPLVLRHFGDMTFQQSAAVLGLPPSTVKSRVHAALRRLRVELRKRGLDEREMP
jgi:RNA polymerase sigma-70 factor (ECF subfamily)